MTTFSQLVDDMVTELRRPDLAIEIGTYLNQSIRECHFDPETNASLLFQDNLKEATALATGNSGLIWEIPSPGRFQQMLCAKYPTIYDSNGEAVWPKQTTPGRHLRDHAYYYYRVGGTFVFSGPSAVGTPVQMAWYEFPRTLAYLPANCRPMQCDAYGLPRYESGWLHEHSHAEADDLTTNWMLRRWDTVLREGVRAKVFKRVSDDSRARTAYSLYAQLRRGLITTEIAVSY